MSNAKHTPGPWQASPAHEGRSISVETVGRASPSGVICSVHKWGIGGMGEANATLVACAPDMLETLKRIAEVLSDADRPLKAKLEHAIFLAEAAASKAEGV